MGKSFVTLALGTGVAQFIGFAAMVVLTRLYEPSSFGFFQTHFSIFVPLIMVASLRYDNAILTTANKADVEPIVLLCLVTSVVVAACTAAVSAILANSGVGPFGAASFLTWSLPAGVLAGGAYQILSQFMVREKRFTWISIGRVAQTAFFAVIAILLGWSVTPETGLVIADVGSRIAATVLLATMLLPSRSSLINLRRMASRARDIAREERHLAIYGVPGALLNGCAGAITPLAIFLIYGIEAAGFYALVDRMLFSTASVVAVNVRQIVTAEMSNLCRTRSRQVSKLFKRSLCYGVAASFPPYLCIQLFGEQIFTAVFGEKWSESGRIAEASSLLFFAIFSFQPVASFLIIIRRQRLQFLFELLRFVAILAVWMWIANQQLEIAHALTLYAMTAIATYVVFVVISEIEMRKLKDTW